MRKYARADCSSWLADELAWYSTASVSQTRAAGLCRILACWCALSWMAVAGTSLSAAEQLRAGAAATNITPQLGELIVGGWSPMPADEVHDELHARCLVLDDGQDKLAIVICDNVGIPREVFDHAKARVEAATGIPVDHQLMASTHTHSASTARGDNPLIASPELSSYQKFLSNRIVDAVRIANKRLAPAEIGWQTVNEPSQLFNRRWFVVEEKERRNPFGGVDQVRMNPGGGATLIRPAGPVDPEIFIVSVRGTDGRPLAVLANYSLHYVGGIPARVISADYFGVFAQHLSHLLDAGDAYPPFVAMLSNGTSGDVNNIDFQNGSPRKEPYEKMREVGELIAARVHSQMEKIKYQAWVDLKATASDLKLQVRKPDEKLLAHMQEVDRRGSDEEPYHAREKIYAERVQQLAESPDTVDVPLQVLQIGNLGICGIPFEVFAETGLEIKQRAPVAEAFTIELANGSYGYLPTPAQHQLGGYETWLGTNRVETDASVKIVDRLLAMFEQHESE